MSLPFFVTECKVLLQIVSILATFAKTPRVLGIVYSFFEGVTHE